MCVSEKAVGGKSLWLLLVYLKRFFKGGRSVVYRRCARLLHSVSLTYFPIMFIHKFI